MQVLACNTTSGGRSTLSALEILLWSCRSCTCTSFAVNLKMTWKTLNSKFAVYTVHAWPMHSIVCGMLRSEKPEMINVVNTESCVCTFATYAVQVLH